MNINQLSDQTFTDAELAPINTAPAAEQLAACNKLELLYEGVNGPNTFSVESAAYGYIERHYRVCIPLSMRSRVVTTYENMQKIDGEPGINFIQQLVIAFHNYARLVRGNVPKQAAFFMAMYRARLIYLGYLVPDKAGRAVTVDEVDFSDRITDFHNSAWRAAQPATETSAERPASAYTTAWSLARTNAQTVQAYIAHGTNDAFKRFLSFCLMEEQASVIKHITLCAEQYAAGTYLVFRQHGHHYKPEFETKYNILWKATTLDQHPA